MLYNRRYTGEITWNRTRFVKVPGTNRRIARPRPPEEWHTIQEERLRIIPEDLWATVHKRLAWLKQTYTQGRPRGLMSRSASSPYLFSGFLVCSECGGKLVVVTGSGKRRRPRYGCPRNYFRGTCSNDLTERQERLEASLLEGLQKAVLQPEAVDYVLDQFEKELGNQLKAVSGQADSLRNRKVELEGELRRLAAAVAEGGHSTFLLEAIAERDRELRSLTERLVSGQPGSVQSSMENLRKFVHARLVNVRKLLYADVPQARAELARHVDSIALRPTEANGKRYYVATGNWNLVGRDLGSQDEAGLRQFEMVAGAGFEPATFGL